MEFKIVSTRVAVHPVSLASPLKMKSPRTPVHDEPRRSESIALQEDLHVDSFTGNPARGAYDEGETSMSKKAFSSIGLQFALGLSSLKSGREIDSSLRSE